MATVRPPLSPSALRPRRRWHLAAFWGLAALVALAAWFWQPLRGRALASASNGARVACSCRFVAGREIGQCRGDIKTRMGLPVLSADEQAKSVTAHIPLLTSQTATWRKGEGCVLETWGD